MNKNTIISNFKNAIKKVLKKQEIKGCFNNKPFIILLDTDYKPVAIEYNEQILNLIDLQL